MAASGAPGVPDGRRTLGARRDRFGRPVSPHASTSFPDAQASDPAKLGWMVGSPPPPDRVIRFDDGSYWAFPAMRWTVSSFRHLMPTVNVSRGLGPAAPLPTALRDDIDGVRFTPLNGDRPMTSRQSLDANYTDGIVVLHEDSVVYERDFGVLKPEGQLGAMSVTKTFVGTLAAMLAAEGRLDPAQRVDHYVPELAASAFGNAWRLRRARRPRPDHLHRPESRDGDRALCVAPDGGQRSHRPHIAAGVSPSGQAPDGNVTMRRWLTMPGTVQLSP